MDFYERKRKAYMDIDRMLAEKTPHSRIVFIIASRYGFGKSFFDKRVEMVEEMRGDVDVSGKNNSNKID